MATTHNYIEYSFVIAPPRETASEILVAELAEYGFESFVDTENGISAYIQESEWNSTILDDIYILKNSDFSVSYTFKTIEQVNWNEEWEKNFNPITVENRCTIRAPFHNKPNTEYDIVIEPKMSFGTGHHETTYMMLKFLLDENFEEKSVLDMGCGTGVLAIMASKRNAKTITAIDIDPWCYENTSENISQNQCEHIEVKLGDAKLLENQLFHTIIANINRNILLNDLPAYAKSMHANGTLFLSGFYREDIEAITEVCTNLGLKLVKTLERNRWVALKFENIT